jgi:hypothetical protein
MPNLRHGHATLYGFLRSEILDQPQLHLQVNGEAGVGKSHLIKVLSAHLQQLTTARGKANPVARAAPTGVAACGIIGRTMHSLF